MITRRAEARVAPLALFALIAIASAVPSSAQSAGVEYDGGLVAIRRVTVPTAPRSQTTQLVDAGVFDCDGYKSIVLNLAGEIKDAAPKGQPAKTDATPLVASDVRRAERSGRSWCPTSSRSPRPFSSWGCSR